MGTLGRQAEQHRSVAEVEASAGLRLGECRIPLDGPQAEGHDVDAVGADAQQPHDVIAGALRVGDHAVRPPRGGGHEDPHALVADPAVGVGKMGVNEVVDGHHAAKAPPQRRRAREAVHELEPAPASASGASIACSPSTH